MLMMKKFGLLILFAVTMTWPIDANKDVYNNKTFPLQKQPAFAIGETLSYRIHYGIIDAGEATIAVNKMIYLDGKRAYHMVGKGKSVGMAEWFFPTRDVYETYIDAKQFVPLKFIRDVNEGGYIIKRNIQFDRATNSATDAELKKDTVFSVPQNVQDIFSAFYYARNLNVSAIKKGDIIEIPVFLDHELFPFKLKYVGTERIKTKFGKIDCLKFVPVVQKGRVFQDEDDMHLWISADDNHIPMRIKSELLVGSVKIDLDGYKGIQRPMTFY